MTNPIVVKLNFAKKLALVVAGIAAFAVPAIVGILNAPAIHAQSGAIPKWEAVSIRTTKDCDGPVGNIVSKDGKKEGGGGRAQGPSPGRLNLCTTLANIIPQAYVYNATGRPRTTQQVVSPVLIEGAPAWMNSETFQFNAKAEGAPNFEMLWGPMMQVLLEDRFKLKIRRENREVPAYALTVAKGGVKIQPMKGTCAPGTFPPQPTGPGEIECGPQGMERKGPNVAWGFLGEFDDFARILNSMLDRPVVNRAGLTGVFNFHLEFAPDETAPGFGARLRAIAERGDATTPSDPTGGTSIFTAFQEQLGLKLEPAKGPREFLVIEHLERPSEN